MARILVVLFVTLASACWNTPSDAPALSPGAAQASELPAQPPSQAHAQSPPSAPVVPVPGAPSSFADLVERVSPAVVNIYTTQVIQTRALRGNPYFPDSVPEQRIAESLGTGFLVDSDGHVLTNSHVIEGAAQIRVRLNDGREFDAQLVGVDPATDLAVARIEPFESMRYLALGNSDAVRVGDWVLAVGNPFGLNSSVTAGILSARGRRDVPLDGGVRYVDFLQTDASINPGNSGGPLLNMQGEVIGINTAINRDGQGIGFSIPSNMAIEILHNLITDGRVRRSWLGVVVRSVTPEIARQLGLSESRGVEVRGVVKGGPAQLAGIELADIIQQFGDTPIEDDNRFAWVVSRGGVGQAIDVRLIRNGQEQTVSVVLGELPE